jgi:hypothetical protein
MLKRFALMLRELIGLLPDLLLRCPPAKAIACALLGAVLWMVGARFSRSILTLAAVAAGTFVGMRLPAWRGWQIDGMGIGVAGAIVFGLTVFLFHRTCIGALLGGGLMLWAGLGTWIFLAGDMYWDWHNVTWDGDMIQFFKEAWQTLPPVLGRVLPAACFAGLAGGVSIAVFLPKLSKVLAHSLIGVTLMAVMGTVAVNSSRPEWLAAPGSLAVQGAVLIGLVLVGAFFQWQITPPYGRPASAEVRKS